MNSQDERCSRCEYWKHRVCEVTGEVKNDHVCDCDRFRERKTK